MKRKKKKSPQDFTVKKEEDEWINKVLNKLGARKPKVQSRSLCVHTSLLGPTTSRPPTGVHVLYHLKG